MYIFVIHLKEHFLYCIPLYYDVCLYCKILSIKGDMSKNLLEKYKNMQIY